MTDHVTTLEKILLNMAQPELYRLNSFRVTELPVDAEARDISRRQAAIKQAIEIGHPVTSGHGRVLPLKEQTEADQLSEAMQRLADPVQRLVDELFWFWPREMGKSRHDPALAALGRGEIGQVYNNWLQSRDVPADEGTALHNLAILSHTLALDGKDSALTEDSILQKHQEMQEQVTLWKRAFQSWRALLENEAFWSRVTARIRALDDPRLTTGMVPRIRKNLPLALLLINARLAVHAVEHDDAAECQHQLDLLHNSGFDKQDVSDALHQAVEPLRERIKTQCNTIDPLVVRHDPTLVADKALIFLDQTEPMLKMLDQLLPTGDATHDGMHDEVASLALRAAIIYGNKTDDWQLSTAIVTLIQPLAIGELLRERVKENHKIMDANLQAMLCWYCQTRLARKDLSYDVPMYGHVKRQSGGNPYYQLEKFSEHVPRCQECWQLHRRASTAKTIGGISGAILAALGTYPVTSIVTSIGIPRSVIVILAIILLFWLMIRLGRRHGCAAITIGSVILAGLIEILTNPDAINTVIWNGFLVILAIILLCRLLIWLGIRCGSMVILGPQKVRAEKDVRSFPHVKHALDLNWKIGTAPSSN